MLWSWLTNGGEGCGAAGGRDVGRQGGGGGIRFYPCE